MQTKHTIPLTETEIISYNLVIVLFYHFDLECKHDKHKTGAYQGFRETSSRTAFMMLFTKLVFDAQACIEGNLSLWVWKWHCPSTFLRNVSAKTPRINTFFGRKQRRHVSGAAKFWPDKQRFSLLILTISEMLFWPGHFLAQERRLYFKVFLSE